MANAMQESIETLDFSLLSKIGEECDEQKGKISEY